MASIIAKGINLVTGVIMLVVAAAIIATQNAASLGYLPYLIVGFTPVVLALYIIITTLKGGK